MNANGIWTGLMDAKRGPPRVLVVGAGSRGNAYARAVDSCTDGIVAAVAEPNAFKRAYFGRRYIWKNFKPKPEQEFDDWRDFINYETQRRKRVAAGEHNVEEGIDAVFICTLDTQHAEIITALGPLDLHIMSEKPLATTLHDCLSIYASMLPDGPHSAPKALFGIGHVLRYSPHNMLLRHLLLTDRVIGDVLSIEHTEPVGWWHFSHSYVRGNWRKESSTAPSLLTKSCHDIDVLLWLLCSPAQPESHEPAHLPSYVASTGHLSQFRKVRKPAAAGPATNCLSCPTESSCIYSAKKIYVDRHLRRGKTDWPLKIVDPEIEDCYRTKGADAAEYSLLKALGEDYDRSTMAQADIDKRPWFGRCVWESDNDVCDDQTVNLVWEDDLSPDHANGRPGGPTSTPSNRYAKSATFHMIAQTEAQCERRGHVSGTLGEITYNSHTITVYDFATGKTTTHNPKNPSTNSEGEAKDGFAGHGGGDDGLTQQFIKAVAAVKQGGVDVETAQKRYIGCTLEDVIRSHAAVFAAEEARRERRVVEWKEWWTREVEARLMEMKGWDVLRT